jgi:hypothetical protein
MAGWDTKRISGMNAIFSRTSVTIDEAVAILLDRSDGPVEFVRIDCDDETDPDGPIFDIREDLTEDLDRLVSELAEAKYDKQPQRVIDEKQATLHQHREIIEKANAYLCIIEDELNKGEHSALHIDTQLSNSSDTYITMASFSEWAKQYGRTVLVGLQKTICTTPPALQSQPNIAAKLKPRRKLRDQEDEILAQLNERGYEPATVPKNFSGKPGIKAEIRAALENSSLFEGDTVFDKAWERVTNNKKKRAW